MDKPLRVLLVEDSEDDGVLLVRQLRAAGLDPTAQRVDHAAAMKLALDRQDWDVVLCDYSMPAFEPMAALSLLRERGLDLPFIIVSGTVADDVAVRTMKAGAHDYVLKDNLARLAPAIEREVCEATERRMRRREEEEKKRLLSALSLYVDPEIARRVSQDSGLLELGGERRELTVLFTDLRGFTPAAETLEPEELVEFTNEYLGAMTDVIFEHNGLLDKYMGDGLMALWGVPFPMADHAVRACQAALAMWERLEELQHTWRAQGLPVLDMGVGINSGTMVVGNLGSRRRFTYSAVGDHVNLGSRLEQLNKRYGTRILISEYTRAKIGEVFHVREIDTVRVRGKQQPVGVYELLGSSRQGELLPLEELVGVGADNPRGALRCA